jgi:hypothetical protein
MTPDKCPVCGAELWCTLPNGDAVYDCGKCNNVPCREVEHLAIERAAEVERLKAQLKNMADFFEDYTDLNEVGQAKIEAEADRLIASARETLNPTKEPTE